MTRGFEDCHHVWILKDGAGNIGQSTYQCLKDCNAIITLQEKCALEQTEALEKSLKILENTGKIALYSKECYDYFSYCNGCKCSMIMVRENS